MTSKRKPKSARPKAASSKAATQWHQAVIADYVKLMAWPGVRMVALGWKERRRKLTARMAVKIYVNAKIRRPKRHEALPRWTTVLVPIGKRLYKAHRVPTDVVWHAAPQLCATPGDFLNPVVGGAMLGVPGNEAGTYACAVADQQGQTFALTAGHVIQSSVGSVPTGMVVAQPPTPPLTVAPGQSPLLGRTVGGFFGNGPDGFVDFAVIRLRPGRAATSTAIDGLPGNGPLLPAAFVVNNRIQVTKFGALTGRTQASFSAAIPSIVIGGVSVTRVYEFLGLPGKLFGRPGDSGALVLSSSAGSQGGVVGLLFATAPPTPDAPAGRGYVFPFDRIVGLQPV